MQLARDSRTQAELIEEAIRGEPTTGGGGGGVGPFGQIDLMEQLRVLWRRKGLIVATTIILMVIATLIIFSLTPRYVATAYVEINPRQSKIVDFEAVLSGLPADSATMETEIQTISSRRSAKAVAERLDLKWDPEFNSALRPPSLWTQWMTALLRPDAETQAPIAGNSGEVSLLESSNADATISGAGGEVTATPQTAPEESGDKGIVESVRNTLADFLLPKVQTGLTTEELEEREEARVIDSILGRLSVAPEGRSRVITISAESESPRTAALIANTLADIYIVSQLEAKFEATKRASSWLNDRVADLRVEVETAERAVEAYREQSGLIQGGRDATLTSEEVSELNAQYVIERTRLAEAEARLRQVEKVQNSAGGIGTLSEVLDNPLIRDLRSQETNIERRISELSEEYGERHPTMISARTELRDLRAKIDIEAKKVIQGLRNEVAVARARSATLKQSLDEVKSEVARANTSEVQLRSLEREAQASRALLENLLQRSKETISQEDFLQADAGILSNAAIPKKAAFPRKGLLLALSLVISIMIGVLVAFIVDRFDYGFRSMEQIERMLGVTPLGLVPTIRSIRALGKSPADYIIDNPTSAYGEAIRSLHTNLLLSDVMRRPKVVLIASALPNEGKTSISLALTRLLAGVGQRVLIIDCDLRRPSVHKGMDLPAGPGIVECLTDQVMVEEAIQQDPKSDAHVLQAGSLPPSPPDLIDSMPMQKLLNMLSK
ncbi:MAG: polysaccharide biosynthesis tyrosine autokinase, partial [Pseudomonadota bacterium]